MKPQLWVPTAAFLAGSIPALLIIGQTSLATDLRMMAAIVIGAVCAGIANKRLADKTNAAQLQEQDKS